MNDSNHLALLKCVMLRYGIKEQKDIDKIIKGNTSLRYFLNKTAKTYGINSINDFDNLSNNKEINEINENRIFNIASMIKYNPNVFEYSFKQYYNNLNDILSQKEIQYTLSNSNIISVLICKGLEQLESIKEVSVNPIENIDFTLCEFKIKVIKYYNAKSNTYSANILYYGNEDELLNLIKIKEAPELITLSFLISIRINELFK